MNLTLALPSLHLHDDETPPPLHLPSFGKMLQYGTLHKQPLAASAFFARHLWRGSLASLAAARAGIASDTPVALVSPMWQQMGLHQANTLSAEYLAVQADEAERLCRDLSGFYADISWRFLPVCPELWLLLMPEKRDWGVCSALDIAGQLGAHHQAAGIDAREWLARQTEIQMWLDSHPVNTERRAHDLPALNGLWLWQDLEGTADSGLLFADTFWRGFADIPCFDLPYDFRAWADISGEMSTASAHTVFMDDLRLTEQTGDRERYAEILTQWEERWFAPLYQAVCSGKIDRLTIACDGEHGGTLVLSPSSKWKFWRGGKRFNGVW